MYDIDIPSQNVAQALDQLAEQTGAIMLFPFELTASRESNAVKGTMSIRDAMNRMLKDSGLSGDLSNESVISIRLDELSERRENIDGRDQLGGEDMGKRTNSIGKKSKLTLAALLGLAASPDTEVLAQDTDDGATGLGLEEIVVTARRREESLRDVPLSISVISKDYIDSGAIMDQYDLFKETPGMNYTEERDRLGARPGIRGVQANNQSALQQKVSYFVDGAPVLASIGAVSFSGLQQIDVLRGPQSTAFGRATFAGAINFVTEDPGDRLTGDVYAATSEYGRNQLGLYVNGPITETLGFSFGVYDSSWGSVDDWRSSDGVQLGEQDGVFYSGKLKWTPNDKFDIEFSATSQRIDDIVSVVPYLSPAERDACFTDVLPNGRLINLGDFDCDLSASLAAGIPRNHDPVATLNEADDPLLYTWASGYKSEPTVVIDRDRIQAEISYTTDNGSMLQLLTSYQDETNRRWGDQDYSALTPSIQSVNMMGMVSTAIADVVGMATGTEYDQTYVDVRWVSPGDRDVRWLVGVSRFEYDYQAWVVANGYYGFINQLDDELEALWVADPRTSSIAFPADPWGFRIRDDVETENTGVYAGVQWDVTEQTTLSAEIRRQEDSNTFSAADVSFTGETKSTHPRVAISHAINDEWTAYGQYSTGTNPAGVNLVFVDPEIAASLEAAQASGFVDYGAENFLAYEEEKVTNIEAGIKGLAMDNRLSLLASIYTMEWEDVISGANFNWGGDWNDGSFDPLGRIFTQTGSGMVFVNGGTAELKGVEVEAIYQINEDWSVRGSAVVSNNEYTDFCDTATAVALFGFTPTKTVVDDGVLSDCVELDGNQIPLVPENTFSFGATYEANLGNTSWSWQARLGARWQDRVYWDAVNLRSTAAVTTWDGTLRFRNSENIEFVIYGNNLTDEDTPRQLEYRTNDPNICGTTVNCQEANEFIGLRTPREIGAKFTYSF